jgi:hypothetical protein
MSFIISSFQSPAFQLLSCSLYNTKSCFRALNSQINRIESFSESEIHLSFSWYQQLFHIHCFLYYLLNCSYSSSLFPEEIFLSLFIWLNSIQIQDSSLVQSTKIKESNLEDNWGCLSNLIVHWCWFSVAIECLLLCSGQYSSIPSSLELIFKDMLLESRSILRVFAFGNELVGDLWC